MNIELFKTLRSPNETRTRQGLYIVICYAELIIDWTFLVRRSFRLEIALLEYPKLFKCYDR